MDGGEVGELEFENFNAAAAKVHVRVEMYIRVMLKER